MVALAASCATEGTTWPVEERGGPLQPFAGRWGFGEPVLDDYVVGFGLPYFEVASDHVVIDRVELLDPGRITLVDARLMFTRTDHPRRHPGYYAVMTNFLTVCAGPTYPPAGGLGPSWTAVGLDLLAGELPALQIYLRADAPGRQTVSGVRVHYQDADGRLWYVDIVASLRMDRSSAPRGGCQQVRGGIWTQGRDYLPFALDLGSV